MKTLLATMIVLTSPAALAAEVSASAPPASDAKSFLLAPKVGFFKTTTPLTGALYAGLEVGFVSPLLDHKLAFALEGNWHQPALRDVASDPQLGFEGSTPDGSYTLTEREIAVLATALYRFTGLVDKLTPYAGIGPGLYIHQGTMSAFGSTTRETESTFGFQVAVGAEYLLGPGAAFAEAHYHFTNIDFLTTGKVNVGGFLALAIGYRFEL